MSQGVVSDPAVPGRHVTAMVAHDLLLFHDPRSTPRPGWWRLARVLGVVAVPIAFLGAGALDPPRALTWSDGHRNASLEIALNRALCGSNSRLSPEHSVAKALEARPELGDVPLPDVAAGLAGGAGEYCRSITRPFLNAENSLMLEMELFLTLRPRLSLRGLGWCLQATRLLALVVFAWALLDSGASLAFAGTVLTLSLGIQRYLGGTSYYSVYPFLPVLLVFTIAVLSLILPRVARSRWLGVGLVGGALGALVAFAAQMRTSHLPVQAVFLLFFFASWGRALRFGPSPGERSSRAGRLVAAALGAAVAYGAFSLVFIRPLARDATTGFASSHHPVAHALVLGLGVPENALSRREGIVWEDARGLDLARRVDPGVEYLRPGYERALFVYYGRLWSRHPGEMMRLYARKLHTAGLSMLSKLDDSPVRLLAWPLSWLRSGVALLAAYGVASILCARAHLRRGVPFAFVVALVAAAGFLLQLESALIYSVFDMTHNSSQLTCFLVFCVLVWQGLVEAAGLGIGRLRRRGLREPSRAE